MTYTGQNVNIFQGDTRTVTVTVYDRNDNVTSIDGATAIKWVVYKRTTGIIYLSKSLGSGITISDGPNGVFEIELENADTLNLLGRYNHECELIDSSSNITTLFTGYFNIIESKANN